MMNGKRIITIKGMKKRIKACMLSKKPKLDILIRISYKTKVSVLIPSVSSFW